MALTYQEVKDYSSKVKSLTDRAVRELTEGIANGISGVSDPYTRSVIVRRQVEYYARKYGMGAKELGAQWYELCAKKAGVAVDSALVDDIDYTNLDRRFLRILEAYEDGEEGWEEASSKVESAFEDTMREFAREPVIRNLDRDEQQYRRRYRQTARAAARAGYARVPVGETCAWCYMLASLGYYYRSEETALGPDPDHYHAHCDCIAVPYHDPRGIDGYGDDYEMYMDMYGTARDAYEDGDYSADMARKIEAAQARHDAAYAAGRVTQPWTKYNAILMIMREQQGLEH